jgi:hypothetical protein
MYVCMYVCMQVCMYLLLYVCMHVCMYNFVFHFRKLSISYGRLVVWRAFVSCMKECICALYMHVCMR